MPGIFEKTRFWCLTVSFVSGKITLCGQYQRADNPMLHFLPPVRGGRVVRTAWKSCQLLVDKATCSLVVRFNLLN